MPWRPPAFLAPRGSFYLDATRDLWQNHGVSRETTENNMTQDQQDQLEVTEVAIETRKRIAEEQANGAFLRACNRGASRKEAERCYRECFETWMQD